MNPEAARREYLQSRVLTSSPRQLVEILYEGALENVRRAIRYTESGDVAGRGKSISRVQAFLDELIASLDPAGGGEAAERLRHLYSRMNITLLKANSDGRADLLSNVEVGLLTLLAWWRGLQGPAESAPENPHAASAAGAFAPPPPRSRQDVWSL